ncbi:MULTISPECIES: IS66 family insertion sequence element accessory protein TnpB [Novosphingobium]|uniref:IS66 family insertion sequence element accessory protein TnpB n=1 Tax=Novosphingobium TaxID=165696 RepID=UPI0022F29B61|nr:IS66 family insertion sequence element accessory protein TnpB [Novosphingobium resinovorum]GLK46991.1 hypothetical protein GCM10017612_49130 [Novosphingobium resinovorum]
MISLAPGTKVYLASKPVSMRLGFDGLAALVRPLFAVETYGGHVFLFRSKSSNLPTFDIRFAPRYDPVSVASIFRD